MGSRTVQVAIVLLFSALTALTGSDADSVTTVELTSGWTLQNQNGSIAVSNIRIPSGVYSANSNEDVLLSYNDVRMRWIAYDNWTYARNFSVNAESLQRAGCVNLTLHGIDTVAEIRLNGIILGRTDNMFVRYSYDIKRYLQVENVLEVAITSPIWAAKARWNDLESQNATVPPACPPARYQGECHVNLLRKMQASFGWDWGLAAPSMGIWKPVTLEYYDTAIMRYVDVASSKNDTHWNMRVRVYMDAGARSDFYAELKFYAVELLDSIIVIDKYRKKRISYKAPMIEFEQAVPIEKVTTWWPNGYGDQKLYPIHCTLSAWLDKTGPQLRGKTISQISLRVGFRTIELVERPAPAGDGNVFLFKVNDQEIFMKGSNYVPSHILPELGANKARIKHLLYSAKEANMNMIRAWGGGIYESDYFYDMADEYGLLIWQDMMFACAMYPVGEKYLASVRQEVQQNAKRLSHHPSIAIFATNNENELALTQNWYNTFHERDRFEREYRELYVGTIMHELKVIEHSSRPRPLVSSPSNGKRSEQDNYISEHPNDDHYGDMHFYAAFTADGWDPSIYVPPRFASEFGFQSMPRLKAWHRIMHDEDDLIDLFNHRQHHPASMWIISLLVRRHLPLPLPESAEYPEALIYFSQVSQAMATKTAIDVYRMNRATNHQTMGALYWQLNDVWVAPSWSSIDYYGNYKLLHYWAKEFFAPIAITAIYEQKTDELVIGLICDQFEVDTNDLSVTQTQYLWSNLFPVASTTWPVTLRANGVHIDKRIPLKDIFNQTFTKESSFVVYTLQRDRDILARTYYFPVSIKLAQGVQDPEIELEVSGQYCASHNVIKMNSVSLAVTVKRPAIFVYIEVVREELVRYRLSRNGFMQLTPVETIHLEFESDSCLEIKRQDIKILTVNQYMSAVRNDANEVLASGARS